ncbi:MAG: radical SAM protein [Candidatus Omnitrophica bacterium]|nr:radical SAM protein [Candidatus Omnitrophota bacterium]
MITPQALDPYEAIEQKTIQRCIPFKLDWELTYRCNLRCIHCYQTRPADMQEELAAEEAFSVIDQLAAMGCLYMTLTGGEVLLRRDFFAIAAHARSQGFALRIFTNGTLIDEECAGRIEKLDPLGVEISLYSCRADIHESITGIRGSFEKTVRAFKLLKALRVNAVVKATFMEQNQNELEGLRRFADELDCPFRFSFTVIPKLDGSDDLRKLRVSEECMAKLWEPHGWMVSGISEGGLPVFEPLCAAAFNSLYISPYGEVYPCVTLRKPCGTVRSSPIAQIWSSPFFKEVRSLALSDLTECRGCPDALYCDRCSGLAFMEKGDMRAASPNDCVLARMRKRSIQQFRRDHG